MYLRCIFGVSAAQEDVRKRLIADFNLSILAHLLKIGEMENKTL